MIPPRGLWGIADRLPSAAAAEAWARTAASCAAWTLRRPDCGDREATGVLRGWVGAGRWAATHARGDLATAGGAQAVIAGWRGLPLAELRRVFPGLAAGASVHDLDEARRAVAAGAAFLVYGPVWETPSKRGLVSARGTDALTELCATVSVPVVALGGVSEPHQVELCAHAGAHAVAVLRAARDGTLCAELASAYSSAT